MAPTGDDYIFSVPADRAAMLTLRPLVAYKLKWLMGSTIHGPPRLQRAFTGLLLRRKRSGSALRSSRVARLCSTRGGSMPHGSSIDSEPHDSPRAIGRDRRASRRTSCSARLAARRRGDRESLRSWTQNANDGIIATAGILEGVAGAGASDRTLITAATTATIVGMLSVGGA